MLNTYLVKLYFYNGRSYEVEVQAETANKAISTLLETLPKTQKNKNLDCIKVNRIN